MKKWFWYFRPCNLLSTKGDQEKYAGGSCESNGLKDLIEIRGELEKKKKKKKKAFRPV